MSSLNVCVTPVLEKKPHPNADRLEMIKVKGWWVVVQNDLVEIGDNILYIPPDAIIPEEYAEKLGITKYLTPLRKDIHGVRPPSLRVRAARIRGEASYGTIDTNVDPSWPIEENLADALGICKWEPPQTCVDGDAAPQVPAFHKYTSIENLRNYPDVFDIGEEVVFTEKLHGKNCRIGLIVHPDENGVAVPSFMAGSHDVRRREVDSKGKLSDFWTPLNQNMKNLLRALYLTVGNNVIVFGELINTQKGFKYGVEAGALDFRAFDISVNMRYVDHDDFTDLCKEAGVPTVPIIYRGPFSWDTVESFVNGPTLTCDLDKAGSFKGREGIVIKPVHEGFSRLLPGSGRKIAKVISVDYLELKTKKGNEEMDVSDA